MDADVLDLLRETEGDREADLDVALRLGRARLGWHGEALPEGLTVAAWRYSRGVYLLRAPHGPPHELVLAPAGDDLCRACDGRGREADQELVNLVAQAASDLDHAAFVLRDKYESTRGDGDGDAALALYLDQFRKARAAEAVLGILGPKPTMTVADVAYEAISATHDARAVTFLAAALLKKRETL